MAREIFIYLLIGFIIGVVAGAGFVYSRIETIIQERIGKRERSDRLERPK